MDRVGSGEQGVTVPGTSASANLGSSKMTAAPLHPMQGGPPTAARIGQSHVNG